MMTGKKPKNHPLCKINKQVRLKSAVEILGVLKKTPLKMTALLFEARVGKRSQRGKIYPPWKGIPWAITGTRKEKAQMETVPHSVKSIRLKVYLADYQGSEGKISSESTTIPMK